MCEINAVFQEKAHLTQLLPSRWSEIHLKNSPTLLRTVVSRFWGGLCVVQELSCEKNQSLLSKWPTERVLKLVLLFYDVQRSPEECWYQEFALGSLSYLSKSCWDLVIKNELCILSQCFFLILTSISLMERIQREFCSKSRSLCV